MLQKQACRIPIGKLNMMESSQACKRCQLKGVQDGNDLTQKGTGTTRKNMRVLPQRQAIELVKPRGLATKKTTTLVAAEAAVVWTLVGVGIQVAWNYS